MEIERNPGCDLDLEWVCESRVNLPSVQRRAALLSTTRTVKKQWQAAWLLRALTCTDLTTLGGDDTDGNVRRLCGKAARPLRRDIVTALGGGSDKEAQWLEQLSVAAVCVYPLRVPAAVQERDRHGGRYTVAAVATGFPSGQYPLATRLEEIRQAVAAGADEIDVVISRPLALMQQWQELYTEVQAMREACGAAHLKVILGVGECGSLTTVRRASLVSMMAGADFIKTSTGKEGVNATLPIGLVMCRAIREYHQRTGYKVGFKPAGGIRTAKDAISWLVLIKEELGNEWLDSSLFRLGASSLLTDIERQLFHYTTGRYAAAHELPMP